MTLRECYEMMCGDYEGVTGRLVSESLVRKFALKFLNDPSFGQLQAAIESGDGAEPQDLASEQGSSSGAVSRAGSTRKRSARRSARSVWPMKSPSVSLNVRIMRSRRNTY